MKKTIIGTGIAIIVVAVGSFAVHALNTPANAEAYDAFAQCLADKGAIMYGAWWCPHCKNQKKLFGKSFKKINDVECADPTNPRAQIRVCDDAKIKGYPTWIFSDGSRIEGEASFAVLGQKTGCVPPMQGNN